MPMKIPRTRAPKKSWQHVVNSTIVRVIALAQLSIHVGRAKRQLPDDRLEQQLALLQEELRLVRMRLSRIPPHRRPHYTPIERLAILELRAARGWNLAETAKRFLLTPETIAEWMKRIDEQGKTALLQTSEPVNKFSELVRYSVQRLKVLCPKMGTRKIALMLCRAGLHVGPTSVRRILDEPPRLTPNDKESQPAPIHTTAPNQQWHVDLTTVPVGGGFWLPWLPFSLPQCWPFCWWVAVVVDHFSRKAIGFTLFDKQPTSMDVRAFLGRAFAQADASPDTLVCDKGMQFVAQGFRQWCKRRDIELRHGAVGKQGSIAVVERFIRTMKEEGTRRTLVAQSRSKFRRQLAAYFEWYNEYRPHSSLKGATPNEVYFKRFPANRKPRLEPRKHWPRGSPCAKPQTLVAGQPGDRFELVVDFHDGQRHTPVVSLQRVAA